MSQSSRAERVALCLLLLAACGGAGEAPSADAGAPEDAMAPSDATLPTAPDATTSGAAAQDGAEDQASPAEDSSADDAGDGATYAGLAIHVVGTVVESPSGSPLAGVVVCPYAQLLLSCTTSSPSGVFDVLVPANSETGVTLALAGRDSVLVPILTAAVDQIGWEIGMPASSDVAAIFEALGAAYPDATTGFLSGFASLPNEELGVAGITMAIAPASGKGPIYLTAAGAPQQSATSTSTDSIGFFGNAAPGEYTLTFAPASPSSALDCTPNFGGWPSLLANAARIPIAAGFDTHLGMECTVTAVDAGADAGPADGSDGGLDASPEAGD